MSKDMSAPITLRTYAFQLDKIVGAITIVKHWQDMRSITNV